MQLGQTLQLETIAEGIEDHAQLLALRRLGCQLAQGYHFGRPGPAAVISELLVEAQAEDQGRRLPPEPRSPHPLTAAAEPPGT